MYHTTKYLPTYSLPPGLPSTDNLISDLPSPKSVSFQEHQQAIVHRRTSNDRRPRSFSVSRNHERPQRTVSGSAPHLPLPATTPGEVGTKTEKPENLEVPKPPRTSKSDASVHAHSSFTLGETDLLPARDPPQYSYFDLFPFSLMVKFLTKRGRKVKGKKAANLRAKMQHNTSTQNLPLEISLYIVRFPFGWSTFFFSMTPELVYCRASKPESHRCGHYVYVPCLTLKEITNSLYRPANLIAALNQLVDALTGLERILTTPIPYSSVHLCSRNRRILMAASQIFGSSLGCDNCLLLLFGRST